MVSERGKCTYRYTRPRALSEDVHRGAPPMTVPQAVDRSIPPVRGGVPAVGCPAVRGVGYVG